MSLRPATPRPTRLSVPELAREVALPYTPRLLRVQTRVFLTTLGAFLLLALPLALLASLVLRGGLHQTFADRALRESQLMATLPPVAAALGGTLTHDRVADPAGRLWTRFTLDLPAGDTP